MCCKAFFDLIMRDVNRAVHIIAMYCVLQYQRWVCTEVYEGALNCVQSSAVTDTERRFSELYPRGQTPVGCLCVYSKHSVYNHSLKAPYPITITYDSI